MSSSHLSKSLPFRQEYPGPPSPVLRIPQHTMPRRINHPPNTKIAFRNNKPTPTQPTLIPTPAIKKIALLVLSYQPHNTRPTPVLPFLRSIKSRQEKSVFPTPTKHELTANTTHTGLLQWAKKILRASHLHTKRNERHSVCRKIRNGKWKYSHHPHLPFHEEDSIHQQ